MFIQLLSEILDMNIDEIAVILIIEDISPDMFIELVTGEHFIPVNYKILKQVIFFPCNYYLFSFAEDFPWSEVQE